MKSLRRSSAFTIVELLIATTIMTIISGLLLTMFDQTSKSWIYTHGNVERNQSARISFDILTRDLQQALVYPGRVEFYGYSNSVFFCSVSTPLSNAVSDIAEVAYTWSSNNTAGVTNLYRYYTPPTMPYTNLYWNPYATIDVFTNLASSFGATNIVAEHVIDFSLTYYDTNGVAYSSWDSKNGLTVMQSNLPASVFIRMTILDQAAAKRVSMGVALENVTNEFARTFETLVAIPTAPTP